MAVNHVITSSRVLAKRAHLIWILLSFMSLILDSIVGQDCSCNCTELDANDIAVLLDLKSAITNDTNNILLNWTETSVPCSASGWSGVSCDSTNKVTCLGLGSQQLIGSIPESLGYLSNLQILYLDNNTFRGPIPSSLGLLSNLLILRLEFNSLSGPIPDSLGSLTALTGLSVTVNRLNGTIPPSLGQLLNLEYLYLNDNYLTGPIPDNLGDLTSLQQLVLINNRLSGPVPSSLGNLTSLTYLSFGRNYFLNGPLPSSLQNLVNLERLQLDANQFTGPIPEYIGGFVNLTEMNLNENRFDGFVPESFSQLTRLKILGIANNTLRGPFPTLPQSLVQVLMNNNQFSGEISEENVTFLEKLTGGRDLSNNYFRSITTSSGIVNLTSNCFTGMTFGTQRLPSECESFCKATQKSGFCGGHGSCNNNTTGGNECSCDEGYQLALPSVFTCQAIPSPPPSPPPPPAPSPPPPSPSQNTTFVVVVSSIGGIIVFISLLVLTMFLRGRALHRQNSFDMKVKRNFVQQMSLALVKEFTNNFSEENKIGKGGFGVVYKGVSPEGEIWAVKRAVGKKGNTLENFKREVDTISKMFHQNILSMKGYCIESGEQLLIFEFMENGTLKDKLKCTGENSTPLNFDQRLKIAIGTAEGLRYLHFQASPTIIHRDVKTDNILLDAQMEAKVADFGLLKDASKNIQTTGKVGGTPGYIDPEYYSTTKVTMKSDVYSFGVVLLEILSGLPPVVFDKDKDTNETQAVSLASFARSKEWNINSLIDPKLGEDFPMNKATSMMQLAKECLARLGEERPNMEEVSIRLGNVKYNDEKSSRIQVEDFVDVREEIMPSDLSTLMTVGSSSSFHVPKQSVINMR